MVVVPVRNYDPLTRRGEIGAWTVVFPEEVVRRFNGKHYVVVRVVDKSTPQPKVLVIGFERERLFQVTPEDLTIWEPKGAIL